MYFLILIAQVAFSACLKPLINARLMKMMEALQHSYYIPIFEFVHANATALLSRITVTLICPG